MHFSLRRPVDQHLFDQMRESQSWLVTVTEHDADELFLRIGIHRVPLYTNYDVLLHADIDNHIPHNGLADVLDGWHGLNDEAARLVTYHRDSMGAGGPRVMVVEPFVVLDDWDRPGVCEFLLATAISELQDQYDLIAVAQPVDWWLKGRARTKPRAQQIPAFEALGFQRFTTDTWILAAWDKLHDTRAALDRRMNMRPEPAGEA
jgi:hypothetical protein